MQYLFPCEKRGEMESKMIKGIVYNPVSPQLGLDRDRENKILTKYNY